MSDDPSYLGKLFAAKSAPYLMRNVDHSMVEGMLKEGWEEYGKPLKTKTRLRKPKTHDVKFEDDLWCQLYRLGYRHLNIDRNLCIPFGPDPKQRKQIDVVAINGDSILVVECKSSEKLSKAPTYKTAFEGLSLRLDGFSKTMEQMFGRGRRLKYIFATRNIRMPRDSADALRLEETGSFFYNDNSFDYVDSLIKTYKGAAHYQFLGMLFKGHSINKSRIEVPAIEGRMGGKTYYMFSLEPHLLLKLGFVLHRTRANEAEMPTYQRLLVPSRLSGISKFIEKGGYFPNSAIVNFSERGSKLEFQAHSRLADSSSRTGVLKIPNCYAIAYIIDGQHRIYGYADSTYKDSNTIPVVAFVGLEPSEQLELFMDINQNQKAVSPTLRITLEEDLYWNATRLDSRLKALRSSIIRQLGGDQAGPLYGKISLGEDKAELQAKPFADALLRSGLIPEANGNRLVEDPPGSSLYDVGNTDHKSEMPKARTRVTQLLNRCYEFLEEACATHEKILSTYVLSNKGTFAIVRLVGSLHAFECGKGSLSISSSSDERMDSLRKYLKSLVEALLIIDRENPDVLLGKHGSGAETVWLRTFQLAISDRFPAYDPPELQDWRERQDKALQDRGRELGTQIERHIKASVIYQLKILFGENWDIEIGSIQRECETRAKEQIEKNYKEGLGRQNIPWTDQFFISDYKTIIERYWTRAPDEPIPGFKTFEQQFSIDVGQGFKSKSERVKWLSLFSSLRNLWAHEGTKEKGLNQHEVDLLKKIHDQFYG
ncbi:DGQHR domain-containing protein [Brevundimonas sp.]|uniref:DGQHR domain-containing protein n=1 Tax=Brevundimonas sp. TaxID=1871086 RepID=UPI002AC9E5AB|nr:DGQHR domain-containing protein [Brevundimonas sp.]